MNHMMKVHHAAYNAAYSIAYNAAHNQFDFFTNGCINLHELASARTEPIQDVLFDLLVVLFVQRAKADISHITSYKVYEERIIEVL